MLVKDIAKICHEVNKIYCESIGDFTQTVWEDAPDWQKQSAIDGVKFHIANPYATTSASHDNWMKEKVLSGWVYGPEKNTELKQHPCLVPFEMLPIKQQVKDYLFKNTVKSLKLLLSE